MIAQIIQKNKWYILILLSTWTIICFLLLPRLKIDVDFSNFFPKGDPSVMQYQAFKEKMGSNDHFIAIAIKPVHSVFNLDFLNILHRFTLESAQIEGVESSSSITTLSRLFNSPFGFISRPYIHLDDQEHLVQDSIKVFEEYPFTQSYINPSGDMVTTIVKMEEHLTLSQYDSLITRLESLIDKYSFAQTHMMGKKLLEVQYQRLMRSEFSSSLIFCILAILIVLFFFYRSTLKILIPLLAMIIALLSLYGFMALTGRSLGIMASLFPTIILIVGISDSIHIITKYHLELKRTRSRLEALRIVIREVGFSISLTSVTTVFGFLTLTMSSMSALVEFGIDASIGIIFAYIISITLVPLTLLILPMKTDNHEVSDILNWSKNVSRIFSIVIHHRKEILLCTALLLAIACWGINIINTNNLQISNIPKDHTLKEDYQAFEDLLGGARSFEMMLQAKDTFQINHTSILSDIQKIHQYLNDSTDIDYIISPITFYSGISKVFDRSIKFPEVLSSNSTLIKYTNRVSKLMLTNRWKLVGNDNQYGRIIGRMQDKGRIEVAQVNDQIIQWMDAELDTSKLKFQITGKDLLIDKGHEHRINNMLWGILLALIIVALFIGLYFKSLRIVLITLLTNIIPLILIGGLMGFTGIELRGTTSIIFAVGFVIVVDDTIHFLSKFKIERDKGLSPDQAIKITLMESGKAIVTTSIILFTGFIVLLHSSFGDIYSVGILVGAMLIFALVADLFLVPTLLLMMIKK